jgi:hypothetical protein
VIFHTGGAPASPPYLFELYAYDDPADLLLTEDDFDRPMTLIATVDPWVDGSAPSFGDITVSFDVADVVNAYLGSKLGFQVRLKDDLATTDFARRGYGMGSLPDDVGPPKLVLTPEPGTAALLALGLAMLEFRRRRA